MTSSSPLPDFDVLSGTWESPVLEPMPLPDGGQTFLARAFDFDDKKWRVRFSLWLDSDRHRRLFDGIGEGEFELEGSWTAVPGARAAVFHFSRRLLTVHTRQLAKQLTESGAGQATWAPGIQQDVSSTGALFVPSLAKVPTEYDLLVFDKSPNGQLDLYLGDRSHEMNEPNLRPKKRSTWPIRRTA